MKNIQLAFSLTLASVLAAQEAQQTPEKLSALRTAYQSAITRATDPITKTYGTELERLKVEFTQKGDLQSALAVDAELKGLIVSKSTPTPSPGANRSSKREIESALTSASWKYSDSVGTSWAANRERCNFEKTA